MSHKDFLINDAKLICRTIGISFLLKEGSIIIDGMVFKEYKKALSYIYEVESTKNWANRLWK